LQPLLLLHTLPMLLGILKSDPRVSVGSTLLLRTGTPPACVDFAAIRPRGVFHAPTLNVRAIETNTRGKNEDVVALSHRLKAEEEEADQEEEKGRRRKGRWRKSKRRKKEEKEGGLFNVAALVIDAEPANSRQHRAG